MFVYPNKGPVAANYGLEDCRFLRPIYHNDTVYVRLTCKQKIDRDPRGKEHPSGIVKWYVEVFDLEDELVAIATILTMVQKKQEVFTEITTDNMEMYLSKLDENSKPSWGIMTPQHMVEHLEYSYRIASSEIQDFEISTLEKHIEKVQETLYNYKPMPVGYDFPLYEKGQLEVLKHENLSTAKLKLLEARNAYLDFYKENPKAIVKNVVFGHLEKYEWYLLERKHLNHHFKQFGLL